ncbi:MAG: imidazole glycerol phosphate synthase subunit HisH [Gammaproteobacteria bacterium]
MSNKITLLDYGMCNLLNVARAFEHCGAEVTITEDAPSALKAEKLVVPGVGAFRDSILEVEARGFGDAIKRFVDTGRPFLGICVGMQMLFETSEEFGDHPGLGVLSGSVKAVPKLTVDGAEQRIPHIGWNHLVAPETGRSWHGSLLEAFEGRHPAVYFVHSFAAVPTDPSVRLADTVYGGHRVCAAVQRDNIMATQFHPERSGEIGLDILRGFMRL